MNKKLICTISILLLSIGAFAVSADANQGVYEYVVKNINTDFETASQALTEQFSQKPFTHLGTVNMSGGTDCDFSSNVFVVYDSIYAAALLNENRTTAPFATAERINLFQDESGLHVSIVNPHNIHRTMLMQNEKLATIFNDHKESLRTAILQAITGETSNRQYGQIRDKDYIGKTMGVMAGGPFNEKIKLIAEKSGDFEEVVEKLHADLSHGGGDWGLRSVYSLRLAEDIVVLGITGGRIENKSFSIVNAGADKERSDYACPGLAHAGAYPVEVVVVYDGGIKIYLVDMMYRMKMYFEDAGKIAFMKNMTMPGSLTKELATKIEASLK